jgi:Tol biopolymer transport system component
MRLDRARVVAGGILVSATLGSTLLPQPAEAQYFGRNKVQYENFDFQVLKTEHFDIHYYPEAREAVEEAGRMAERWYARLSRIFNHELSGRQIIILYADHPDFEQTTALMGAIDEGTGGVTEAFKRRVVLPMAGSLKETDHVLGHELVHAFQFDITTASRSAVGGGFPIALAMPLWFIEGMAEYLSLGPEYTLTAMWMHDAARRAKLPSYAQLYNPVYNPYRYGHAFWAYVGGRWGDPAVGEILKAASMTGDPGHALATVLEIAPDQLIADWQAAIDEAYQDVLSETGGPLDYGRMLISKQQGSGFYNVAPAISPDGSNLVFLTEKDYFHIEMFSADAETGEIGKKLVKTASDPHYESLQFINSAGSFHPNSREFVFAGVVRGVPSLTVIDTERGKTIVEHRVDEVGEIFNPTFSADGSKIVFSASVGGLMDLFYIDVETREVTRLTEDPYADLQPVWSPDGRYVVFVTDRFSTNMERLEWGAYELGLLDIETGTVTHVPGFDGAKNINPQWAADGESVFFLSDQNGISNVYRVWLDSGEIRQITHLTTGVSGITDLSPAITLSANGQRMVFSAFEGNQYSLYSIESEEVLAGEPIARPISAISPAVLPPADRAVGDVMALVNNPDLGLPRTAYDFESAPYKAGLSLDYIAPPNVAVGSDRYGTFVGGGTSLFWSDILGEHNLATMLQVNGSIKDIAALVSYENRKSRWNWGAAVSQFPIVTQNFAVGIDDNGNLVEQELRFRQTSREIQALVTYPLSRAQRIEFTARARNISFETEIRTRTFTASGQQIGDERQDFPSCSDDPTDPFCNQPALNLASGTAAMVYDNTIFGFTGPVLGQRYRVEVAPTGGSLNYIGTLFDYRRYFMPFRNITFAGRLLQFGRFGKDGEDFRLTPLFIGYQQLLRGYDPGSFSSRECADQLQGNDSFFDPNNNAGCPVYDQLFGSRMLMANFELRMPIPQVFGWRAPGSLPPFTMAFFFDVGAAWWSQSAAARIGGNIDPWSPVASVGIASRINLFGVLLLEVDFVRPLSRPSKGWFWQFGFSPGF